MKLIVLPVNLISGDLDGVSKATSRTRIILKTIQQNIFWAFIYNIILITTAALGYLNPMQTAVAMVFSNVFVVTNSVKLSRARR